MSPDPHPPHDLPELPELSELTELLELPASLPPPAWTDGRPPLRVLGQAPRHLRTAALIVVAGSLLPWMGSGTGWLSATGAKLIALAAAWVWWQQVLHDFGPKLSGPLLALAELHLKPATKKDLAAEPARRQRIQKEASARLEHPFPTGLHGLALVLVLAALVVALGDQRRSLLGPVAVAEVGMLAWASFTWVHIGSYERWGGFNPLFPLMFLAMLFAGAARALTIFGSDAGGSARLLVVLGGGAVAAGGGLAVFTIAEAMLQAKKEGDRKKAEALEARKSARKKREE